MTTVPRDEGANSVASVTSIRRYPVKSMQGEELGRTDITARGVIGDRAYAVMDRATGFVASAKHPRKWAKLLACHAAFLHQPEAGAPYPPVRVTLPDGSALTSDQADADDLLSRALGRDVSLRAIIPGPLVREADRSPSDTAGTDQVIREEPMAVASPPGTFFDYAPVHVLSTNTLASLGVLHPSGRFDARRFRPNLVVTVAGSGMPFPEHAWLGHVMTAGARVRLMMIDPCPRCVVTTLAQGALPHDPGILRTIAQHSAVASVTLAPGVLLPAVAGVYATVLAEGFLARGDSIALGPTAGLPSPVP